MPIAKHTLASRARLGYHLKNNILRQTKLRFLRNKYFWKNRLFYDTGSIIGGIGVSSSADPVIIPLDNEFNISPDNQTLLRIDSEVFSILSNSVYPNSLVCSREELYTQKTGHSVGKKIYSNQYPVWYDSGYTLGFPNNGLSASNIPPHILESDPVFISTLSIGDYVKIENEIVIVKDVGGMMVSTIAEVYRGRFYTSRTFHATGVPIYTNKAPTSSSWYDSGWKLTTFALPVFSTANTTGWSSPLVDAGPSPNITISGGDVIKINSEEILINNSSGHPRLEVTLGGRGYNGTTSAAHQSNDLVYVNHS